MRQSLLLATLMCCMAGVVMAQSLRLSAPDISQFPVVTAKFYAFDAGGNQGVPSASELSITENGVLRTILSVTCPTLSPPSALSSVLVIDISGSMAGGAGAVPNIELARTAAREWVQELVLGQSECAISSFDDANYLNQDFTTDRSRLLDAIARLTPRGGTDYNAGLLDPVAGGLQVSKNGKNRRVIVFLTDGTPYQTPKTAAIISEAVRQNCAIYTVTLGFAAPKSLKDISLGTGGAWFDGITSLDEVRKIYSEILHEAESGAPCEITWQSGPDCSSQDRSVSLSWNGSSAGASFTPPSSAVVNLKFTPGSMVILSKPLGIRFDTTITVTSQNGPVSVTGIASSNPAFSIAPTSFTLPAGASKSLTISYTPPDSGYNLARLTFQSDNCQQSITAIGAYPGRRPDRTTLKVERPNGGELLPGGSETTIEWSGILPTDTVRLDYSLDGGASWQPIVDRTSGLSYRWHVPHSPSTNCLVRAIQLLPRDISGWADRFRGDGDQQVQGMGTDGLGNIYVAVSSTAPVDVGDGTTITAYPNHEILLARYWSDGTLDWVKRLDCTAEEMFARTDAKVVAVDATGNVFITGTFAGQADFGGGVVLRSIGRQDLFVAKFAPDGTLIWARSAGGAERTIGRNIAVDAAGNCYVSGRFSSGVSTFGQGFAISARDTNNLGQDDIFIARYSPDGTVEWAISVGGYDADFANGLTTDLSGNLYLAGGFGDPYDTHGSMDFGNGVTLAYTHDFDGFVAKYRPNGTPEWATAIRGQNVQDCFGIAVDRTGGIYVGGSSFAAATDFGGGVSITPGTGARGFLARYRPDGTCEWARGVTGTGQSQVHFLTTDASQNVYLTGYFDATFGPGDSITSTGQRDIFVARFLQDGTMAWGQRAGGGLEDEGAQVAVSALGDIYVTGTYSVRAEFQGRPLEGVALDGFVWKIGEWGAQRDSSDALFAIADADVHGTEVDMRQALVGSAKDSVVERYVTNSGGLPVTVHEIRITGIDSSEFSIVSGIPPFDLSPNGSHEVEFRFHPTSAGIKSAQLLVITSTDTLLQTIRGEGIQPSLSVVSRYVDFGQVRVGDHKDSLAVVAIANIGSKPLTISGTRYGGPNATGDFSILAGSGPFALKPGDTARLDLQFAPWFDGRTSGTLFFDHNGFGSPAQMQLFGEGIGPEAQARIVIDGAEGSAGDSIDVPVELTASLNLPTTTSARLAATLRFNASLLAPIGDTPPGTITNGERIIQLELPTIPVDGNVLALLHFRVMLGNDSLTPLHLEKGALVGSTAAVRTGSDTFHLLGFCRQGGLRLFNPDGHTEIVKISPNPAGRGTTVELEMLEAGNIRVELLDMLGRNVATLAEGEFASGTQIVTIPTGQLAAGSYYLRLRTPTVQRVARLDIVK